MNTRGKMQLHTKQRLRDDKVKLIAENKELKWQIERLQKENDNLKTALENLSCDDEHVNK